MTKYGLLFIQKVWMALYKIGIRNGLSSMKMGSLNMGQLSDTISKGLKESFLVCDRNILADGKTT